MKLIHVTDTHIIPEGTLLYDQDPTDNLIQCIEDINQNHSDADLCIITGDLTHRGDDDSFIRLHKTLLNLQVPYELIIGNHDHRETAQQHFPKKLVADDTGFLQKAVKTSAGVFLLLDTVKVGTNEGEYCQQRLDWLDAKLTEHKDESVFLCMHHAPFKTGLKAMDTIGMIAPDADAFTKLVTQYKNIKHVFIGHYHRPISGQWHGMSFSTLRSMMLQTILDFHNEEEVIGKHEQPQYCVVLFNDDRIVVHFHDFADTGAVHHMGTPAD